MGAGVEPCWIQSSGGRYGLSECRHKANCKTLVRAVEIDRAAHIRPE